MRRTTVLLILVLAALAATGCRGLRPHTGLATSAYDASAPLVARDHRGQFFLVLPDGQRFEGDLATTRHVVLRRDGEAALFYAWPVDERTARLASVSPGGAALLDSSVGSLVDAERIEDLGGVEGLSAGVGLVEGGDGAPIRWLGPAPALVGQVVLAATHPGPDATLDDWLLGAGVVKQGVLTDVALNRPADERRTYFALPDGDGRAAGEVVATLGSADAPTLAPGLEVTTSSASLRCEGHTYRWEVRPIGLEAGADYLLGRCEDAYLVAATLPRQLHGTSISLTEDPLRVEGTAEDAAGVLSALALARGASLLSAAATLPVEGVTIAGSTDAVRLRRIELVGAAGYMDWAQHELIRDAEGIHAGEAYYLARARALAGERADARLAVDALGRFDRFAQISSKAAEQGRGRSYRLLAELADLDGLPHEALRYARDAAASYKGTGDAMAAAEAELAAASFALQAGEPELAVKLGRVARSRFFHGGAVYHSAFAELRLAEIYAALGQADEAEEMAGYAQLRFQDLDAPVGANRARIVVAGLDRGAASKGSALLEARRRAAELRDEVGVALASAAMLEAGAPLHANANAGASEAASMWRALGLIDDPELRSRVERALGLLCGEELVDAAPCARLRGVEEAMQGGPHLVRALITRSFGHLSAGREEEARAIVAQLDDLVNEPLRQSDPILVADAQLLRAVAARGDAEESANALMAEALSTIRTSFAPVAAAEAYASLASRYGDRGYPEVAAALADAGATVAGEAGQSALQRRLVWSSIEHLRRAGAWEAVLTTLHSAEPVLGGAGAAAAPQLARLLVYRADAFVRLERSADAAQASRELDELLATLDAPPRIELRLLQADLAATRGDAATTASALDRAEALDKELSDGQAEPGTRAIWRAQVALLRGRLALQSTGQSTGSRKAQEAFDHFRRAAGAVDGATGPQALGLALDAFVGMAAAARDEASVQEAVAGLESLGAPLRETAPGLTPRLTAARADVQIARGDASAAWAIVEQARLEGRPPGEDPASAGCLRARAATLASAREENLNQWLNECVRAGTPAEAFDAALLRELAPSGAKSDAADPAERVERLVQALEPLRDRLVARDRLRLKLAQELSESTAPDPGRFAALRRDLEAASDAERRVRSVTELVDLLLDAGRPAAAEEILDAHSRSFYQADEESQQILVRLRLRSQLQRLRPVDTLNYASRALSETALSDPHAEAAIRFLLAQNDALLGLWHSARANLTQALSAAERTRDRKLKSDIKDFARRFTLELPAD